MGKDAQQNLAYKKSNYILLMIAVFASLAVYGFTDSVRGVMIPRMQADFAISELQIGLLLATSSVGYLIACLNTAALARKIGIKGSMLASLFTMIAAGVCICFSPTYIALLLSFFVLNIGYGMLDISQGIISASIFTKNTGTMMNLAHFFFGAGAVISPVISVSLMTARFGDQTLSWRYMYLIVLGFAAIPCIPVLLARFDRKDNKKKKTRFTPLLKNSTLWLVVLIFTLGMICEAGVGSWLVSFLEATHSFSSDRAALYLTLFFACLTLGRLVLGPVIDKIGFINTLVIATSFAGIMITVGVLCGRAGTPLLVLAGIGVAPLYPTVMAVIAKLFSKEIDIAVTIVLTIMGVIMVAANFMLGGIVYLSRRLFTSIYGESGIGTAYAAGYLFIGFVCFGAFAAALALRAKQKKAGKLV